MEESKLKALERASVPPELRERLGQVAYLTWLEYEKERDPDAPWLLLWEQLSEPDKEVERRIGCVLFQMGVNHAGARVAALEQHISELEKSLESARKERDEWQRRAESLLRQAEEFEAELARLKPSGQVSEDAALVATAMESAIPKAGLLGDVRAALSRLATKAQGYETALAQIGELEAIHAMEIQAWDAERQRLLTDANAELTARLATAEMEWSKTGEKLARACEERDAAVAERDEAWSYRATALAEKHATVANNAALLSAVNDVLNYVHLHSPDMGGNHRYSFLPKHGPAVARLQHLAAQFHPGEGLLEQHRAEVDALKADNAALVRWINEHGHRIGGRLCPYTGGYACEPGCDAHAVHAQPHPGAPLLEELNTLRGVQAQANVDAKMIHDALGWAGEWPRSLPAPSRAVVALLEELVALRHQRSAHSGVSCHEVERALREKEDLVMRAHALLDAGAPKIGSIPAKITALLEQHRKDIEAAHQRGRDDERAAWVLRLGEMLRDCKDCGEDKPVKMCIACHRITLALSPEDTATFARLERMKRLEGFRAITTTVGISRTRHLLTCVHYGGRVMTDESPCTAECAQVRKALDALDGSGS